MAINDPDCYAWRLFVALSWPAGSGTCRADQTKRLGDAGSTVWESWRSKYDTYLDAAVEPPPWDSACTAAVASAKVLAPTAQAIATREARSSATRPAFLPPQGAASTNSDEEVRLNKDTYEFIRTSGVYDLNKQEELAKAGVSSLVFPLNAKEAKAHWLDLTDEPDLVSLKQRYHWAELRGRVYGLVALHIITRDLPRWFWSTFEHVDNEQRWPDKFFKSRNDPGLFRGWIVQSVDNIACEAAPVGCNAIPSGFGLENTKWANYRLRGTQVDWVDHRGKPTILVNSKIEAGFDQRSSCISCHSLAVKGESGRSMPFNIAPFEDNDLGLSRGYVGPIPPQIFHGREFMLAGPAQKYLGLDFVWSLRCARRKGETAAPGGCKLPSN